MVKFDHIVVNLNTGNMRIQSHTNKACTEHACDLFTFIAGFIGRVKRVNVYIRPKLGKYFVYEE